MHHSTAYNQTNLTKLIQMKCRFHNTIPLLYVLFNVWQAILHTLCNKRSIEIKELCRLLRSDDTKSGVQYLNIWKALTVGVSASEAQQWWSRRFPWVRRETLILHQKKCHMTSEEVYIRRHVGNQEEQDLEALWHKNKNTANQQKYTISTLKHGVAALCCRDTSPQKAWRK